MYVSFFRSSKCEKSIRGRHCSQNQVFNEIATFLKFKWSKGSKKNDSADDLFGKTFAAELKMFPEQRKCLLKHEITTLIYRYERMEVATLQMHSASFSDTEKIL